MLDPRDLPYTENPGAVTATEAVICVVITLITSGLKLFGVMDISTLVVVSPLLFLLVVMTLYRTVRNAVHEATRLADADHFLDEQVTDAVNFAASRTLTPNVLSAKMKEMSE